VDDPEKAFAVYFQVEHPVASNVRQDRMEGGPSVGQTAQKPLLRADPEASVRSFDEGVDRLRRREQRFETNGAGGPTALS
jgi:hypothetical protein